MTEREAMELAYGMLWLTPSDRKTSSGQKIHRARISLREVLTPEQRRNGVKRAQDALSAETWHIGKGEDYSA